MPLYFMACYSVLSADLPRVRIRWVRGCRPASQCSSCLARLGHVTSRTPSKRTWLEGLRSHKSLEQRRFCEDAVPRARFVGGARLVACPNPALHEKHCEKYVYAFLQLISALGTSANTTEEPLMRKRVIATNLRLLRGAHTLPERVDFVAE